MPRAKEWIPEFLKILICYLFKYLNNRWKWILKIWERIILWLNHTNQDIPMTKISLERLLDFESEEHGPLPSIVLRFLPTTYIFVTRHTLISHICWFFLHVLCATSTAYTNQIQSFENHLYFYESNKSLFNKNILSDTPRKQFLWNKKNISLNYRKFSWFKIIFFNVKKSISLDQRKFY